MYLADSRAANSLVSFVPEGILFGIAGCALLGGGTMLSIALFNTVSAILDAAVGLSPSKFLEMDFSRELAP